MSVLGGGLCYLFYAATRAGTNTITTKANTAITTATVATARSYYWLLGIWVLGYAKKMKVLRSCVATKKQDLPCYSTRFWDCHKLIRS